MRTQLSTELLARYDVNGPRYTSYPTAAQFDKEFSSEDFLQTAVGGNRAGTPLSLYFHIPFCHSICYYCACNKIVTRDTAQAATYLDYLYKEMHLLDALGWQQRPVTQLHFGGGTPTFLDDDQLARLMKNIGEHYQLLDKDRGEYSIELDPRTIDNKRLALLRTLGFNRASLGIQDFDSQVQAAINRRQDFLAISEQMQELRRLGFHSINFDLIYGLPFQNAQTVNQTLDKVLQLSPDRISCYNYAHLPQRFSSQRSIDRQQLPTPTEKISLINTVINKLTEAGYVFIGMDHFVKPDDSLAIALKNDTLQRNFQGYSLDLADDMLSLGVSSISDLGNAYSQNYRKLEDYYLALDAGRLPVEHGLLVNPEDHLRRDIIQQITCHRVIDIALIEQRYSIDFKQHFQQALDKLKPLAADGIVSIDKQSIQVTPTGQHFLRHIAMAFDQYLGAESSAVKYSKAI